jgi:predicted nucleic-acid-binding Zn-ribbon protein
MRKSNEEKAKLSRQKFPIHYVSGQLTACGLEVSRLMAVTGNYRRVTCCRCIDTNVYDSAAAENTRSNAVSDGWKQQKLFGGK